MGAWRVETVGSGFMLWWRRQNYGREPVVWALLLLMASAACTRDTEPGSREPVAVTQQTSALSGACNDGTPCPFSVVTPSSLTQASLLLSATSTLKIDDRVTVKETSGTPATIANLGTATLQIGTDGHLGDIWSRGPVTIGDRTIVNGTIHGNVSVTTGNSVTVKAKDNKSFTTTTNTSSVTFPTTNAGGFDLEPGATGRLGPGSFGAVAVKSRSTLHVSTGSYLMESLDRTAKHADAGHDLGPDRLLCPHLGHSARDDHQHHGRPGFHADLPGLDGPRRRGAVQRNHRRAVGPGQPHLGPAAQRRLLRGRHRGLPGRHRHPRRHAKSRLRPPRRANPSGNGRWKLRRQQHRHGGQ